MPVGSIKQRLSNMTDREKIMIVALVSIFCITVAAVAFALVQRKTSRLEAAIEENEKILDTIESRKDELKEQTTLKKMNEARFEKKPPELLGTLEQLAGEVGIDIPESRDLPDETIGKKWIVKSADIRLKKIGLDTLVKLMVKIKNQNRKFPIAMTKINIKKRHGEPNSYDIQMTVASFSKKQAKKKKSKKTKGAKEKEEVEGTGETGKTKEKQKPEPKKPGMTLKDGPIERTTPTPKGVYGPQM